MYVYYLVRLDYSLLYLTPNFASVFIWKPRHQVQFLIRIGYNTRRKGNFVTIFNIFTRYKLCKTIRKFKLKTIWQSNSDTRGVLSHEKPYCLTVNAIRFKGISDLTKSKICTFSHLTFLHTQYKRISTCYYHKCHWHWSLVLSRLMKLI